MIQRKVRILTDMERQSLFGSKLLSKGEIITLKFRSEEELASTLNIGLMEFVPVMLPEGKEIPVLLDEEDENISEEAGSKNPWISATLPQIAEELSDEGFYDR